VEFWSIKPAEECPKLVLPNLHSKREGFAQVEK